MSLDEIKQTFFLECGDLLEQLEEGLLEIESGESDAETLNVVFRAVHSIKGGAGAFGLDDLVSFAHIFETALDEVRSDRLEANAATLSVLLRAADVLSDLVGSARDGRDADEDPVAELKTALADLVGEKLAPSEDNSKLSDGISFEPAPLNLDEDFDFQPLSMGTEPGSLEILFTPTTDLFRRGHEPRLLFKTLETLGTLSVHATVQESLSLEGSCDDEPALSFKLDLETDCSEYEIEAVFEFVRDDCVLIIKDCSAEAINTPAEEKDEAPVDHLPTDMNKEDLTPLNTKKEAAQQTEIDRDITSKKEKIDASPQKNSTSKAKPSATVRVDLDRIDRLINLVGELVITQAVLTQSVAANGNVSIDVTNGLEEFKQLTREVQESVMAIRTQPVKPLFQRMNRIVREATAATGKKVRLVTDGEATEVDKTVLERLADPLTHMIRNSVDHGIEPQDERQTAGKTDEGCVSLSAAHRSGRVIIEVRDDGRGINRERVFEKAVERELISPDADLSDQDIDNLLFMPGFSTAQEVSALSGRGVGMDVVKKSISALGGRVSISSEPGKGTTLSISLPLTLAVLDGMVVSVSQQVIVIPLTAVLETFKASETSIHHLGEDLMVSIRGEFIPVIDINRALGFSAGRNIEHLGVIVLLQTEQNHRYAVVVDEIVDQRQVVIKGLEKNYGSVQGISAATILGNGQIALILDADGVGEMHGVAAAA